LEYTCRVGAVLRSSYSIRDPPADVLPSGTGSYGSLGCIRTSITEKEIVGAIVFDGPAIRLALLDCLEHCRAKVGADLQVFAREDVPKYIVGHKPVRYATFVFGCVS